MRVHNVRDSQFPAFYVNKCYDFAFTVKLNEGEEECIYFDTTDTHLAPCRFKFSPIDNKSNSFLLTATALNWKASHFV